VAAGRTSGTFEAVVPDMKGARRLVLHGPGRVLASRGFAQLRGGAAKMRKPSRTGKVAGKPARAKAGKTKKRAR